MSVAHWRPYPRKSCFCSAVSSKWLLLGTSTAITVSLCWERFQRLSFFCASKSQKGEIPVQPKGAPNPTHAHLANCATGLHTVVPHADAHAELGSQVQDTPELPAGIIG